MPSPRSPAPRALVLLLAWLALAPREVQARGRPCVNPLNVPEAQSRFGAEGQCIGLTVRAALTGGLTSMGGMSFTDDSHHSYAVGQGASPVLVGVGPTIDLGMQMWRFFYVGGSVQQLTFGLPTPLTSTQPDFTSLSFTHASYLHVVGVMGAAFMVGPVALRHTLMLGRQYLTIEGSRQQGEIVSPTSADTNSILFMTRFQADWFFHPHFSASLDVATELSNHLNVTAALSLAVHGVPFDGLRRLR